MADRLYMTRIVLLKRNPSPPKESYFLRAGQRPASQQPKNNFLLQKIFFLRAGRSNNQKKRTFFCKRKLIFCERAEGPLRNNQKRSFFCKRKLFFASGPKAGFAITKKRTFFFKRKLFFASGPMARFATTEKELSFAANPPYIYNLNYFCNDDAATRH